MWSERLVLGAVGLLFSGSTWAGACCMGATSVTPARVGRCEKATAGVMLGAGRLKQRLFVPVQIEPAHTLENGVDGFLG